MSDPYKTIGTAAEDDAVNAASETPLFADSDTGTGGGSDTAAAAETDAGMTGGSDTATAAETDAGMMGESGTKTAAASDAKKGGGKSKKWRIRISIGLKTNVAIFVLAAAYFFVAVRFGGEMNEKLNVDAQLGRNYSLGRALAIITDQQYVIDLYDQVRQIYEATPEEISDDPMDPSYLAQFDVVRTEQYGNLKNRLRRVAQENAVLWIALELDDEERGRTYFVLDTDEREDGKYALGWWAPRLSYTERDSMTYSFARGISTSIETKSKMDIVPQRIPYASPTLENGDRLYVVRAPFYYSYPNDMRIAGYVSVGQYVDASHAASIAFVVFYGIVLFFLTFVFIIFCNWAIHRMVVHPVRKLTNASQRYRKNREKSKGSTFFQNLKIRSHDEIRILADSMAEMEEEMTAYLMNLKKETAERERMSTELDVAAHIQSTMLPTELTGYDGGKSFGVSSLMRPAREVGGDFYDYFVIDQDHIGLTIADVSGKGVPAALFMVVSRTLIKNVTIEHPAPAQALRIVNEMLLEGNDENMFVTVWLGVYKISERKLVYVNAGHESPAVYRASEGMFSLIEEDHDVALGIIAGLSFTERELVLAPGDAIYLYTDGVPEAVQKIEEAEEMGASGKRGLAALKNLRRLTRRSRPQGEGSKKTGTQTAAQEPAVQEGMSQKTAAQEAKVQESVAEAVEERFGLGRMIESLNAHCREPGRALLESVLKDIDTFACDAPQFDDVTMLMLNCRDPQETPEEAPE